MNAIELNQIMAASVGLVRYQFPEGPMIPLQSLFNILNTHCQEARILTVQEDRKATGYKVVSFQTQENG